MTEKPVTSKSTYPVHHGLIKKKIKVDGIQLEIIGLLLVLFIQKLTQIFLIHLISHQVTKNLFFYNGLIFFVSIFATANFI